MLSDTVFYLVSSLFVLVAMPLILAIKSSAERGTRKQAEYEEYLKMYEERLQRRIRESLDSADRLYARTEEKKLEPRVQPAVAKEMQHNCPNCGAPVSEGERCAYCGTYYAASFPAAKEMDAVLLPCSSVYFNYQYCSVHSTTISGLQCSVVFPPPRNLRQ